MKKTIFFVVVVVVVLIAGIALKEFSQSAKRSGSGMGRPQMASPVEVETVKLINWAVETEAVGTAYANESVELTTNVSDTVETIHFDDGQQVKKGDILVVLNHNEEDAELDAAKATLAEEERESKRLSNLMASRSVSQSLLDGQLTKVETAKYRVAAIEARLKDRYIRAPFAGVLGLRQVSVGSFISPGKLIATLDDIETIKLDFSVPAVALGNLTEGMRIAAKTPAYPDREFIGVISTVDSRVNPIDRSLKLRAEIQNKDLSLKPGLLLNVLIKSPDREALVISESAIVQNKDKHFVYVVEQSNNTSRKNTKKENQDGTQNSTQNTTSEKNVVANKPSQSAKPVARLQEVIIGVRKPGVVEIISGLEPGQKIISRGTNTVRENGSVNIVAEAS